VIITNFIYNLCHEIYWGVGNDGGFRFDNNGDNNTRWRTGATFNFRWSQSLKFNGGMEFEKRRIEDYNLYSTATNNDVLKLIESQSVEEESLFGQIDYQRGFSNYTVFANLSYNHQGNRDIRDDKLVAIVPKITTSFGFSYLWDEAQNMGFSLHTISKRNQARASYLLNTNYKYKTESYSLSFTLKNLLGKKIIYPDTQDFVAEHLIEGD
jgi:hypothetical protein